MIYFGSGTSFQTGKVQVIFSGIKNIDKFPAFTLPYNFTIGNKKVKITDATTDIPGATVTWEVDLSVDPGQDNLTLTLSDMTAAVLLFPGIIAAGVGNVDIQPGVSEWYLLAIAAVIVLVLVLFFHFKK